MIEQLFEVATEFRFDVGQALINTGALQQAVDGVAKSSGNALNSLSYLASGLVAHLGFGSGGLLSVLTKAVQLSEAFDNSALNFSNTIEQNMGTLSGTIHTFNDRLLTSQMILENISQTAIKYAIPTSQLADLTQKISTPLANRGKLGTNFGNAIEMSKNLMLAAPAANVNPMIAGESLYRALSEHQPLHGQLFSRLANTQAFKSAHVTTQMQLANMNPDKKIDLLAASLKSLATDSDALNFRLNTLHGQFTILQDIFSDIGSILRPIGEAVKKPLIAVLKYLTGYFREHGKELGQNIANLLGSIIQDPEKLFVNLVQLKRFGSDFKKALHLVELYGTFRFIKYIIVDLLGIALNGGLLLRLFSSLRAGVMWLVDLVPWSVLFSGAMNLIRLAIVEVLPIFLGFLAMFQIFSRAKGIAHANDIKNSLAATSHVTATMLHLKVAMDKILTPITTMIDFFARLVAPLFEATFWLRYGLPLLDGFVFLLDKLGNVIVGLTSALYGIIGSVIDMITDLIHMKNPFGKFLEYYRTNFMDFHNRVMAGMGDPGKMTQNVVNNNHIEARFDMREQLEPDRIAFAVTQSLKKLALNPQQGRGQSILGFTSGRYPDAGNK